VLCLLFSVLALYLQFAENSFKMLSVFRAAGRRLIPAIQPAISHRATLVAGPPKDPMSFTVYSAVG